ncbi:MAG TPA: hypothetical protein VF323_07310, partial [Candidatus Limnocylindrales bacterium]
MVELEPLRGVGGGQRECRVVGAERREQLAALDDRSAERVEIAIGHRPCEQRRGELVAGERRVRGILGRRGVLVAHRSGLGPDDPAEADQERQARIRRGRPREDPIEARVVERCLDAVGTERDPSLQRHGERGQELAVRPREERPAAAVVRPGIEEPGHALDVVRRIRSECQPARRARPCPDGLGEPLAVAFHEANRVGHDRSRATVVRDEVHAPESGQRARELEDAPYVGQPPAVDRLVVVPHEEDPVGRCGEQEGEAELAAIDVLDLVDEQVRARDAPAGEDGGLCLQDAQGAGHEIVEVETTQPLDLPLVRHERPSDGPRFRVGGDL